MRRVILLLPVILFLGAAPAFAESISIDDCKDELPNGIYDKPSCVDYELNSALIASVESGDESAIALLEARYSATGQYQERYRIAAVLLRRVANDRAIWNELYTNAKLAVRWAGVPADDDAFVQWCEERDFYFVQHGALLHRALQVVSTDPRSRSLLRKALAVEDEETAFLAVIGLAEQRDVAALPEIEKALERFPDHAEYVAGTLMKFGDERANAIAKKYLHGD